ncbi:MAG: type II secretion system F family protein [Dehalococcoidales bacterium]
MTYKYTAYTTGKKIVQGTLEVASESLAEGALYRAGYERVLSLKEVTPGFSLEKLLPSFFGVKTQEVIDFANQLSTLIESGISALTSLELLARQTSRKAFKKIITALASEIREGGSLSQALARYPKAFPDTYRQFIRASEQAGNLGTGLKHAAVYTEKQAAASQKIKHAMAYPVFVLLMAAGVSVLLIIVALPPLVNLFKSLGAQLPWTTRGLISITSFLFVNKLYVLAVIVLLIVTVAVLLRFPSVKIARDNLILKIPVTGTIITERSMQHLCQTASMLLQAGLRLPLTMDIIIQGNRNRIIRRALEQVRDRLLQGEGLSLPMSEIALFPPLLVEMTAVGEKSGAMDSTLATLADYYEKKVDRSTDVLIAMIEPALTVLVGLVVIFIALSVITPLYSILRSMR